MTSKKYMKFSISFLISLFLIGLVIVVFHRYAKRPVNDGRTPAERRQIAEACLAMLHSSLTNKVNDINVDDPTIPAVINALHPYYVNIMQDFAVEVYRKGRPEEYFLARASGNTNTWILYIAGPSTGFDGGREILRIEKD